MVVLTNGSQTVSPGDPDAEATDAKNAGIEIYGIAYGSDANENTIEDISSLPKVDDGQIDSQDEFAFLASDIGDVEAVFTQIGQEIGGEICIWEGSFAGLVEDLDNFGVNGFPLDGAPQRNFALNQGSDVAMFDAGVHCLGFEWYVPCTLDEMRNDLGSSYTLEGDAAEGDAVAGEQAGSMFNELADRGVIAADGSDFDINIIQTDQLEFGAEFAAVQGRHNMNNTDPFPAPVADNGDNGDNGGSTQA